MVGDPLKTSAEARHLLASAGAARVMDDIVSASTQLERALQLGVLEPALEAEIRITLADYYFDRNMPREAAEAVAPALGNPPDPVWRARALVRYARALLLTAEPDVALPVCVEASATLAPTSHHLDYANAQISLAHCLRVAKDMRAASRALHRAVAAAERGGSKYWQAIALNSLGSLEIRIGSLSVAEERLLSALELESDAGNRKNLCRVHLHLGVCRMHRGDWDGARESLGHAEETYGALEDGRGLQLVALARARLARLRGRDGAAVLGEAQAASAGVGFDRVPAQFTEERGYAAVDRGDYEVARVHFEELLGTSKTKLVGDDVAYDARSGLALALLGLGRRGDAVGEARAALAGAKVAKDALSVAGAWITLGRVERSVDEIQIGIGYLSEVGAKCELLRAHRAAVEVLGLSPERTWHVRKVAGLELKLGLVAGGDVRDAGVAEGGALDAGWIPMSDALLEKAHECAAYEGGVLVKGEAGVGRAQLAGVLHDASRRAGALVRLDCRGVSSDRFVGELLGEGGANGALERARGGTLQLENVDHLGAAAQAVLYRELVGVAAAGGAGAADGGAAIAVVSTASEVFAAGSDGFAPELYALLGGLVVSVPALRERPQDLRRAVEVQTGRELDAELLKALGSYAWPGNFTELREAARAAKYMARGGPLSAGHFPMLEARPERRQGLRAMIDELEVREIQRALREAGGNKTRAADALGISRKGLFDRLKRLGLWER